MKGYVCVLDNLPDIPVGRWQEEELADDPDERFEADHHDVAGAHVLNPSDRDAKPPGATWEAQVQTVARGRRAMGASRHEQHVRAGLPPEAIWTYKRVDDPIDAALFGTSTSWGLRGRLGSDLDRPDLYLDDETTLVSKMAAYAELVLDPNLDLLAALAVPAPKEDPP